MRVTYVITRGDSIGGAQVHVLHLATESAALGHEISVVTGARGPLTERLETAGIEVRICPGMLREISPIRDLNAVRDMTRILRGLTSDVVSTHSSKGGIIGRLAARRAGIPALFTAHGWAFTDGVPQPKRALYRAAERMTERMAARIICVSEHDREIAVKAGMSPDRLVTIHNGVPDIDASLRARPDSGTPVRLVMTARIDRQKDHETLFRALTTHPGVELDLIGDGPDLEQTRAMAERFQIGERVHFLGQRDDVAEILSRAQIFVLSSRWEGFPRATLEAMRAGLPVVVSNVGGASEAVTNGVTGFVVAPGDRETLAERLRDLVRDPALRASMGAAGRARYEAEFSFERMLTRTLALQTEVSRAR